MNSDLSQIIQKFNDAQEETCRILHDIWNMPRPITAEEWIDFRMTFNGQKERKTSASYKIFPHGVGLAFKSPEFIIDFDFGENGESNGFDANRLFNFIESNNIISNYNSADEIKRDIDAGVHTGEIVYSGYINYYLS